MQYGSMAALLRSWDLFIFRIPLNLQKRPRKGKISILAIKPISLGRIEKFLNQTICFWVCQIQLTHLKKSQMNIYTPRGVKKSGRSLLYENKKIGVERRDLHVWKALNEWNNFKKACYGLMLILFMI